MSVVVVNLVTIAADAQAGRPGVGLLTASLVRALSLRPTHTVRGRVWLFCDGNDLKKRLRCGAFGCWRRRTGAGDHVA